MSQSRFERDTAVERVDDTTFAARMDAGWWIHRGPNGGYLAAVVLRAFTETVGDPDRAPRSISLHYMAPPEEGDVRVETHVEREGGSLTTVSGRLWQGDQVCISALAAFSRDRPGPEFQDLPMPNVVAPADAPPLMHMHARPVAIRGQYDQREVTFNGAAGGVAAVGGGWMRLHEPAPIDAPVLVAFSDGWPPAIRHRVDPDGEDTPRGVPTVDLTVHFRRRLPLPGMRPEDYCLARFTTRVAHGGFLEEDGEIWSPDGVLLAQSRQLGLFI